MDREKLLKANKLETDIIRYSQIVDEIEDLILNLKSNSINKLTIEGRTQTSGYDKLIKIKLTREYSKFINAFLIEYKRYYMTEIINLEKEFKKL